ncbi:hypothetical protein AB0C74_04625 [Spirillospora sp. NPDC048832]
MTPPMVNALIMIIVIQTGLIVSIVMAFLVKMKNGDFIEIATKAAIAFAATVGFVLATINSMDVVHMV